MLRRNQDVRRIGSLSFARELAGAFRLRDVSLSFSCTCSFPLVFLALFMSSGDGHLGGCRVAEGAEGGALSFQTGQPRFFASVWVIPCMCL